MSQCKITIERNKNGTMIKRGGRSVANFKPRFIYGDEDKAMLEAMLTAAYEHGKRDQKASFKAMVAGL